MEKETRKRMEILMNSNERLIVDIYFNCTYLRFRYKKSRPRGSPRGPRSKT